MITIAKPNSVVLTAGSTRANRHRLHVGHEQVLSVVLEYIVELSLVMHQRRSVVAGTEGAARASRSDQKQHTPVRIASACTCFRPVLSHTYIYAVCTPRSCPTGQIDLSSSNYWS